MYFETIKNHASYFNKNIKKYLPRRFVRSWLDLIWCFLRFGAGPNDYFRYEFYKKSNYERNKFITYKRSVRLISKYNDNNSVSVFEDKVKFNEVYSNFTKRDFISLEDISKKDLTDFVTKYQFVILKPRFGSKGYGIKKICVSDLDSICLDDYRGYIAEEFLVQCDMLGELNPNCVNTIRVLTFMGRVISCALRVGGSDSIVDNISSSGVCAHINIEKGIIDSFFINTQLETFIEHPFTKVRALGREIPNYQNMVRFVEAAARVNPQLQYVGWDVAVLNDGFAIIEANHDPGHRLNQMCSQIGLYERIQNIVKEKGGKNSNQHSLF